jgi:hypothetical protein
MRIIERQMLAAVLANKDWRSSNTRVQVKYFAHAEKPIQRIDVYLHNNRIAQVTADLVSICDCGWQTPTTKSRLNALLRELCGAGIYQKSRKWYAYAIEEQDWEVESQSIHHFVRG